MSTSLSREYDPTVGREDARITKDDKRKFLKRLYVTDADIIRIANCEQRTPDWYEARKYRLTGSNFGGAAGHHKASQKTPTSLLNDLLWPGKFQGNDATRYGTNREPLIHTTVETFMQSQRTDPINQDVWLEACGLIVSKEHPWLGVSPDDFICVYDRRTQQLDVGLAEYKAPFQKKQFYDTCPHYYYDQFQGQMALTRSYLRLRYSHYTLAERAGTWTKFCVWSPSATQVNSYTFDETYWNELLSQLRVYYMNQLLPRFILKERGVLKDGEIDITPVVDISLPPLDTNTMQLPFVAL